MGTPLFTSDEASDPGYRNIRDGKDPRLKLAKWHCQYLWILFERHADKEFRTELRRSFDARYWEMYLTTSLIFAGESRQRGGLIARPSRTTRRVCGWR